MGKAESPSKEHKLFAQTALKIFHTAFSDFEFSKDKIKIEKYSTTITFRRGNLYIKISGSTYPRDYSYCYNIILGEDDSEDFWEYDWNSD